MPTPPSAALQAICLRLSQIDNYIVTLVGVNGGNYWPQGGTLDASKSLIDGSLLALYGFPVTLSGTYLVAIQSYDYTVLAGGSTPGVLGGLELAYGTTPGLVPTATATFNGGSGDDWIVGSKINQSLYGNAGNDVVNGAGGSDTLNGGVNRAEGSSVSGSPWGDTVSFQASGNGVKRWSNPFGLNYTTGTTNFTNPYSTGVVVNLVSHMYSYKGGSGSVVNFESVWGSDGNDTITGDALGDHLYGGAGNDVITTGAGHDWVQGGSGNNTLDGGAGNNWLDYSYLLGGPQYLDPTPISPYFTGGPLLGADQFRNTVKASTFQTPLSAQFFTLGPRQSLIVDLSVVNASGQSIATISATAGSTALYFQTDRVKNFQAIDGGAGNDIIVGNLATTNIVGNGGDNILYGAGSSANAPAGSLVSPSLTLTTIMGGTGGDLARGPSGNNLILMAAGGNEVVFGYGDGPHPGRKATISFQTVATSTAVVVPAASGVTTLNPYAGVRGPLNTTTRNVAINLSAGSYSYNAVFSGTANTYSSGTITGVDNAVGSDGNDSITGNDNNDVLSGGLGNDTLIGGTGDDTLYGGAGTDVLTGGAISAVPGDAGVNRFYVGYDYVPGLVLAPTDSWINHSTFNPVNATDFVTDWYDRHDYLQVSLGSQATITGLFVPGSPVTTNTWRSPAPSLASLSAWTQANWIGNDIIDQGTGIFNHGTVTIDAGDGANTIDLKGSVTNGDLTLTDATSLLKIMARAGNDIITLGDPAGIADPTSGVTNALITNRGTINVWAEGTTDAGGTYGTNAITLGGTVSNIGTLSSGGILVGGIIGLMSRGGIDTITQSGTLETSGLVDITVGNGANTISLTGLITNTGTLVDSGLMRGGLINISAGIDVDTITQTGTLRNSGQLTIDAGAGDNTIAFSGTLTNTGSLANGGTISVTAGAGNDRVTMLGGSQSSTGDVNISVGDGANTIDISGLAQSTSLGTIKITTGAGNDIITATSGHNIIKAGSGTNIINLGTDTTIHTDRVYISDFGTQNIVNGFGANDKIYISNKLVDALGGAVKSAPSLSSDVVTGGTQDVATAITVSHLHDQESPSLSGPQSALAKPIYDPLFWSNLGRLSYEYDYGTPHPHGGIPLLNGSNGDYTSNGGYTNQVMKTSSDQASTQVIAGGSAMIASGYILVATVLLMPAGYALIALGGLTLAGGIIYRDYPPKNGTLDVPLTGYGNTLESGATVTFAKTSWTARDFNGLLQSANTDGLTPTLEVTGQPRYSSIGGSDRAGINTIVAITTVADTTSGYSTMIYLVHSVDNMIQNNEATLLAQVDNKVFASQLVTYTGDTLTPHLAAPVTAITVAGANISGAVPYVVDVNTPTPVLSITVDESAVAINEQYTLYIYDGNTQLAALTKSSLGAAGRVISFTDSTFRTRLGVAGATTPPADPQAHYRVSTLSDQGIASPAQSYTLVDKTTVIKSIDFTGSGITVNAITAGTLSLTSISGSPTASVTGATDAASGTLTLSSIVAGLNASTYSSPIASSLKMTVGSTTSSSTQMFQLATQNSATLNAAAGVDNGLYALGDFAIVNGSATSTSVTTAGTLTGTSVVVPASSTVLTAGSDVIVAAGSDATINLWDGGHRGNAKIIIAPGSSPLIVSAGSGLASGYDTINHFLLGGAANAYDILQLDNDGTTDQPVIATSLASASAGTILGGTLSDGVITFTGLTAAALGSATGAALGTDLTNIQNYLDAALTAGEVVAFRSGSTDSWVFEKGSSASQDTLIKLVGANVQHLVLQTGTTVVGGATGDLRIA